MLATGNTDFCWCALWWWVCGLCDFCSFVFCVVHAGRIRGDGALWHCCCVWLVVCSLFKGAWWMPWHAEPMKDV